MVIHATTRQVIYDGQSTFVRRASSAAELPGQVLICAASLLQ